MKRITLITRFITKDKNAGQKAPLDIERILDGEFDVKKEYTYKINKRYVRRIDTLLQCIFINLRYKKDSIALGQWPLTSGELIKGTFFFKRARYKIVLLHDLECIRYYQENKKECEKEIKELNEFDVVISHNKRMSQWLIEHGLEKTIIELGIFDYLTDFDGNNIEYKSDYSIVFAGNLNKSLFLRNLSDTIHKKINLYGNKPDFVLNENMQYKGSYSPDELCMYIEGSFGLIWDGETADTCGGIYGNYMKYNNPHKFSLYIACGLPVITWNKAAIADFIKKYNIGITIDNLSQIDSVLDNLSLENYKTMCNNVVKVRKKVRTGYFTQKAVNEALSLLKE